MSHESFADRYAPLLLVCFFSLVAVYGVLGFYHSHLSDFESNDVNRPCTGSERPPYTTTNFLDVQDPSKDGQSATDFFDVQDPHHDQAQARDYCFELLHRKHLEDLATSCAVLHTETMEICDVEDGDSRRLWDCVLAELAWQRRVVKSRRSGSGKGKGPRSGRRMELRDARRRLWD